MVTYHEGDLLNSGCQMICHQVNEFGYMGAGIAKQIRAKYPDCYNEYKDYCKSDPKPYGNVCWYIGDDIIIANCFSQVCGLTEMMFLESAVKKIIEFCKLKNIRLIGIPYKYGCGHAVGEWALVSQLFKNYFEPLDIELQIWKFDPEKEGL